MVPFGRAHSQAGASTGKHVSPSEPLANALGYTEDASKVNTNKFAAFKPGQKCADCRFFQGTAGKPYGPCQIFMGEDVNVNGWCASFNAKT
jgi:hypothetical protein